ncbi:1-acyl-sn-glycerol-3-phosphate acyltransferase [bacterium]|nr:1-acyl-sn-glycerol-3-phosphate acyltransferase [bacterium]
MWYKIGVYLLKPIFYGFLHLKIFGKENIPKEGALIVAANHISYLDPPLVGVALWPQRILHYVAKLELFKIPILGLILRLVNAFPVKRGKPDRLAMKRALDLLAKGEAVCIFPEGTRSRDGRLQEPELGISILILRSGAPVLPVAVVNTDKALPRGAIILHPARIKVYIGKPFHPHYEGNPREARKEIARQVMERIKELLERGKREEF